MARWDVERIREGVSFPDLVAETIPLPRYPNKRPVLVRCPFHDDHHPSLAVYDDHAHCFGCGWHGDAIAWLMQRDGLTFREALETLARKAGIPLRPLSPEEQRQIQERREYEDALARAARHFAQRLWESPQALEYARGRWSEEAIRSEGIGFADGGPLPNLGNPKAHAVASAINRWAGKVGGAIVYVHRLGGRVVYLSGRSIEGKEHYNPPEDLAGPRMPYLNVLYSPRVSELVIVEGPACAITLSGWGIPALALVGTGVTETVADILHRHQDAVIYVVPDTDGKTNLEALANEAGPLIRVVQLPKETKDVNDFAQGGKTAGDFQVLMRDAIPWLDIRIQELDRAGESERNRIFQRDILPHLARLSSLDRDAYIRKAQNILRVSGDAIRRAILGQLGWAEEQYTVRDGCICAVRDGLARPLCNFTAEIVEDVARDDGETVTRYFTITGRLADGTPLPTVRVESGRFDKMTWVSELWGARAVVRAGPQVRDQLREAIQLRSTPTYRRIYTHTGWRVIDDRRAYLTAAGALGLDGVTVELDRELERYCLPPKPEDPVGAMRASLRFLEIGPETVTVPIWAAVYLAPLAEIIPPTFVVWLYGMSGGLKTTLATLALSHYGNFRSESDADRRELPQWNWTGNRLEQLAFFLKDTLMLIDDYRPQNDPRKMREMEANADMIIRDVGNQSGRGRLNSNLSARPIFYPRGMILSTGEIIPKGLSTTARLLTIEVQKGTINLDRLTTAQAEASRYPHALAGYILWLANNWEYLAQVLPRRRLEFRAHILKNHTGHGRIPESLATLYIGLDLALTYATETGALTPQEADARRDQGWSALWSVADAQTLRVEWERPTLLFLETLATLILQGKARLFPKDSDLFTEPGIEAIGWYDTEYLYLIPGASYHIVARYMREEGRQFPIDEEALRKYLAEEGYLVRGEERYTQVVWIGGKSRRVLQIIREKVADLFPTLQGA